MVEKKKKLLMNSNSSRLLCTYTFQYVFRGRVEWKLCPECLLLLYLPAWSDNCITACNTGQCGIHSNKELLSSSRFTHEMAFQFMFAVLNLLVGTKETRERLWI